MTNTTIEREKTVASPRIDRLHKHLTVVSTAIGICGALGTAFVWLMATFYVGDVRINVDQPVDSLLVRVYDREGHEATFHGKNFQLMPGGYHLEVVPPDGKPRHFDVEVGFRQTAAVEVSLADTQAFQKLEQPNPKRSWWQFWRRTKHDASEADGKEQ